MILETCLIEAYTEDALCVSLVDRLPLLCNGLLVALHLILGTVCRLAFKSTGRGLVGKNLVILGEWQALDTIRRATVIVSRSQTVNSCFFLM